MHKVWSQEAFASVCKSQGVRLGGDIASGRVGSAIMVVDPLSLLDSIWYAARQVRRAPNTHLAKGRWAGLGRPLDIAAFEGDATATALANMINDSRRPAVVEVPERNFTTRGDIRDIGACAKIEPNFNSVLHKLEAGDPASAEIYVDPAGKPVFLRKGQPDGITVGLSLEQISVNGMVYDPLSVVRVDASGDMLDGYSDIYMPNTVTVRPLSEVTGVGYARPSAYGMSEQERVARFPYLEGVEHDLATIRAVVTQAVAEHQ